jgi:hypothetical protein
MLKAPLAACTMLGLLVATTIGQEPPLLPPASKSDDSTILMRAKLSSSQKVVEGLMAGDFAMIRKGGEDMQKICDSSQWRQADNQVIVHYRAELRRSAIKLVQQAEEKNLEGAAYTYMHTMTTCINCHQYSRDVLRLATREHARVIPIPVTEPEAAPQRSGRMFR